MRRRRSAALGAMALVVMAATVALVASDARPGRTPDDVTASSRPRWAATVTGWPSALAGDARGSVVIAGAGEVRALDAGGRTRWAATVAGAGLHPPALAGALVAVSAGDRVVALERATGRTRWEGVVAPGHHVGPAAAGGDVVVAGTEEGVLVTLDAATGRRMWSAAREGAIRTRPLVEPAPAVVVAAWHEGPEPGLRAFELGDGAPRWEAALPPLSSAPVASNGFVITAGGDDATTGGVIARDGGTGVQVWSTAAAGAYVSGVEPAARGGDLVVADRGGTVRALDPLTGASRWTRRLGLPLLRTRVVFIGGAVALTTHGGEVLVLDRNSGVLLRRDRPEGFPVALAPSGADLLLALRLTEPGQVEARRVAGAESTRQERG